MPFLSNLGRIDLMLAAVIVVVIFAIFHYRDAANRQALRLAWRNVRVWGLALCLIWMLLVVWQSLSANPTIGVLKAPVEKALMGK